MSAPTRLLVDDLGLTKEEVARRVGDGVTQDLAVAAGRLDEAEQHADGRALAGAVRADEPGHPTLG